MLTFNEYMTLVEQAPIMIWRAGLDTLCNYFNRRWLEFTGRTMDEERGNGWAEGVHPEDLAGCLETYTASFARRVTFEMYYRLRRADGAYRWILDRGMPFTDGRGTFQGFIGSCVDMTEKVEAEQQLRESRESEIRRLRTLLPICAWCKKIRSDDGYWQEVEQYVSSRNLGTITHGICNACAAKTEAEGSPPGHP